MSAKNRGMGFGFRLLRWCPQKKVFFLLAPSLICGTRFYLKWLPWYLSWSISRVNRHIRIFQNSISSCGPIHTYTVLDSLLVNTINSKNIHFIPGNIIEFVFRHNISDFWYLGKSSKFYLNHLFPFWVVHFQTTIPKQKHLCV